VLLDAAAVAWNFGNCFGNPRVNVEADAAGVCVAPLLLPTRMTNTSAALDRWLLRGRPIIQESDVTTIQFRGRPRPEDYGALGGDCGSAGFEPFTFFLSNLNGTVFLDSVEVSASPLELTVTDVLLRRQVAGSSALFASRARKSRSLQIWHQLKSMALWLVMAELTTTEGSIAKLGLCRDRP
jgi:hypothetical protein